MMVREALREAPGRRRRPGTLGYSQLARAPYAGMAYRCVFRGGFVPNNGGIGENGAEPSDAWPVRPIILNGLKRGTPRACNLLDGNFSPQISSFLKRS